MIVVPPVAEKFISEELVLLWNEFSHVNVSYSFVEYTIYFKSDEDYYIDNLPRQKDLLCVINYKGKFATYYINGIKFETEKDYIVALKNIAFL